MLCLQANTDYSHDLGVEARRVGITNYCPCPVLIRKRIAATQTDYDFIVMSGDSTEFDFGDDNTQQLHFLSEINGEIDLEVLSIFKAIHRGDAAPNTEVVIDFREPCQHYDIQNLGAGTMYFAIDCQATVDGPQTLELQPGSGYSADEACTKISIISSDGTRYQVKGRR